MYEDSKKREKVKAEQDAIDLYRSLIENLKNIGEEKSLKITSKTSPLDTTITQMGDHLAQFSTYPCAYYKVKDNTINFFTTSWKFFATKKRNESITGKIGMLLILGMNQRMCFLMNRSLFS